MGTRSSRRLRILAMLALAVLLVVGAAALPSYGAPASPAFITANGISIQAGLPLPVYKLTALQVNQDTTQQLSQIFDGIYNRQPVAQDSYLNKPRFTVPNTGSLSLLQQYGATGGFYAFRTSDVISDTARGAVDPIAAQRLTCKFLLDNQLIDGNGVPQVGQKPQGNITTPDIQFCDFDFQGQSPYKATPIVSATESALVSTQATSQTVGVVVTVPISLTTGLHSQTPAVPLGGPGGHISLLFRTTDTEDKGFSLDRGTTPGLMAVAMPFYGRSLDFLRTVPARDPAAVKKQITDQVRAAYPGATVNVPDPALLYMVSDAAEEQTALEPMLSFEGISVTVGGETIVLRDITAPAAEAGSGATGFGPTVGITAPANGGSYTPGAPLNLVGSISGGTAPYTYQWFRDDDTPIGNPQQLAAAGATPAVQATITPDVSHDGFAQPTTLILRVRDNDGAEREAMVSIQPAVAPSTYLPLVLSRSGGALAQTAAQPAGGVSPAASNYYFGIESGADYPPYGPGGSDLPGVPPDANGFRSGMLSYGWSQRFYWSNASAWERDWRDCSFSGGLDCSVGVDRADFVYWAGHGGPGGIAMPSSKDSSWAAAEKARFQQARWVGFASCQTLRAEPNTLAAPIRRWFGSFRGAHMLLGFNSNMADVAFGPRLMDNLRMPTFLGIPFPWAQLTIREAWVITAFNMNAGKPAYIYAVGTNGVNPVNNKLPLPSDGPLPRPFPVASYHWVWWYE